MLKPLGDSASKRLETLLAYMTPLCQSELDKILPTFLDFLLIKGAT
jgi:hypothetical protein